MKINKLFSLLFNSILVCFFAFFSYTKFIDLKEKHYRVRNNTTKEVVKDLDVRDEDFFLTDKEKKEKIITKKNDVKDDIKIIEEKEEVKITEVKATEEKNNQDKITIEKTEKIEKAAKAKAEQERIAKEKAAKAKAEQERIAKEKAAKAKAEQERIAREKAAKANQNIVNKPVNTNNRVKNNNSRIKEVEGIFEADKF